MTNEAPKIGEGTIDIELAGQVFKMKPCYAAFSQINREIPGGIIGAIQAIGTFDINAMETVIAAGCQFLPERRKTLGEDIFKAGTRNLMPLLTEFLVNLNNGGVPPKGDLKQEGNPTKNS